MQQGTATPGSIQMHWADRGDGSNVGTARLGVVGFPARHSLSPRLHNRAFAHLGMDAVYVALEVRPEGLADAIRGAHALGFRGLNITMPHKEAAFALAARASPLARRCSSANTLSWDPDGALVAETTDGPAIRFALAARGVGPVAPGVGDACLIIGAGGAARAAAYSLAEHGLRISVTARHLAAAERLVEDVAHRSPESRAVPWEARAEAVRDVRVLVQATPLGGSLHPGADPLGKDAERYAQDGSVLVEMAYGDHPTPLEERFREAGLAVIDGREILARQAALSWKAWFGIEGPLAVMEAALRGAGPTGRPSGPDAREEEIEAGAPEPEGEVPRQGGWR